MLINAPRSIWAGSAADPLFWSRGASCPFANFRVAAHCVRSSNNWLVILSYALLSGSQILDSVFGGYAFEHGPEPITS
jgi:hypothetical protein